MISREDKERVIQATDFAALVSETVTLHEKSVGDFWGCCPFHEEKTESFHVNTQRGLYYCFGCGAKGDVIDYVMRREALGFLDALRWLADRAGIELHETRDSGNGLRRRRLLACLEAAEQHFSHNLFQVRDTRAHCERARAYLGGRSMGLEVARRWNLGFALGGQDLSHRLLELGFSKSEIVATDLGRERGFEIRDRFFDRVMFPIKDEMGRTIAFGGRVLDDSKPKYLNSKDSPLFHKTRNLFGLHKAKECITATQKVFVVEGYTDAISLHEAGVQNVVAILGTALSTEHLKILNRYRPKEIVSLLDGDAAGQRAAEKALVHLGETEARLTCVTLPEGKDPAEYVSAYGKEALLKELDSARDLVLFVLDRKLKEASGASPATRRRLLEELCLALAPLQNDRVVLGEYVGVIADSFDVYEDEVWLRVRAASSNQRVSSNSVAQRAGVAPQTSEPKSPAQDSAHVKARDTDDTEPAENTEPLPELSSLSPHLRRRILLERELLALLATRPEAFREETQRITGLVWADPRHGVIAQTLLCAPEDSSAKDRVMRARMVDRYAPQILSASTFEREGRAWGSAEATFMVDEVELESLRAAARELSALLQRLEMEGDASRVEESMKRSAALRERVMLLESRVRAWGQT